MGWVFNTTCLLSLFIQIWRCYGVSVLHPLTAVIVYTNLTLQWGERSTTTACCHYLYNLDTARSQLAWWVPTSACNDYNQVCGNYLDEKQIQDWPLGFACKATGIRQLDKLEFCEACELRKTGNMGIIRHEYAERCTGHQVEDPVTETWHFWDDKTTSTWTCEALHFVTGHNVQQVPREYVINLIHVPTHFSIFMCFFDVNLWVSLPHLS